MATAPFRNPESQGSWSLPTPVSVRPIVPCRALTHVPPTAASAPVFFQVQDHAASTQPPGKTPIIESTASARVVIGSSRNLHRGRAMLLLGFVREAPSATGARPVPVTDHASIGRLGRRRQLPLCRQPIRVPTGRQTRSCQVCWNVSTKSFTPRPRTLPAFRCSLWKTGSVTGSAIPSPAFVSHQKTS